MHSPFLLGTAFAGQISLICPQNPEKSGQEPVGCSGKGMALEPVDMSYSPGSTAY